MTMVSLINWHFLLFTMALSAIDAANDYSSKMDRSAVKGRHFVIGVIDIPPYVLVERTNGTGQLQVDGYVHQIIEWVAKKYQFTFEYVEPPDGAFGALVNGSWNGLVGMAVRGEISLIATALSVTYPRSLVVDFTIPFADDPMSLLIPFPQLESTISGIVKPFQYEVWIGILTSLPIVAAFLWLISRTESRINPKRFRGRTGWMSHFWFLFRVVANPQEVVSFTLATRIVVAAWCLTAVVFVNSYTSSLVSYLMAPKFLPFINTIQDLADSQEIRISSLKSTSSETVLFTASSGVYKKLGDSLRAHPENQLTTTDNVEDIVFHQHIAFPYQETALKQKMYQDYKATKQCRLSIAKEPLFPDQVAFAMRKKSPLTEIFNHELIWLRELGLLNHWTDSFLPRPYVCSAPLSSLRPTSKKKLTINYLSSAFLLYCAGVAISLFIFVVEVVLALLRKHSVVTVL